MSIILDKYKSEVFDLFKGNIEFLSYLLPEYIHIEGHKGAYLQTSIYKNGMPGIAYNDMWNNTILEFIDPKMENVIFDCISYLLFNNEILPTENILYRIIKYRNDAFNKELLKYVSDDAINLLETMIPNSEYPLIRQEKIRRLCETI